MLLGLNASNCYAQWLKYDNRLSASFGYAWGPETKVSGMSLGCPQNTISFSFRILGLMCQWDVMSAGDVGDKSSTQLLKLGAGVRHDIDKEKMKAVAFTPYLGYGWYDDVYKTFVFGSRISYYKNLLELNFDISNRNIGFSIGIGLWGNHFKGMGL